MFVSVNKLIFSTTKGQYFDIVQLPWERSCGNVHCIISYSPDTFLNGGLKFLVGQNPET
jgi:hypothetical protein